MQKYDLDQPLLELVNNNGKSVWTIRSSLEGTQIFGSTGSGKSSATGRMLAMKMLQAGYGGLVLCVKHSEVNEWKHYARTTGREMDLIIIEPGGKNYFNFLEYETSSSRGQFLTDNMLDLLKTVITSGESDMSRENSFWSTALDQLITNVLELCFLAHKKVSVEIMSDIVSTIPKNKEELETGLTKGMQKPFFVAFEKARLNVDLLAHEWFNSLSAGQREALNKEGNIQEAIIDAVPEARTLKYVDQFFVDVYVNLAEKTKSIIDFSFSGFLQRLLREPAYSLFCKYASTVTPEDCVDGKIVVLNIPVKLFHKVGTDCQNLFKYLFQRAVEKRTIDDYSRPVFLWSDENQYFILEKDQEFQTTCRSSRVAVVSITQNLASYYAQMGGQKSHDRVTSLLGTLNTKLFLCNADVQTNQYASSLIGEDFVEDVSQSISKGKDFSEGRNISYKLERLVRPESFARLKTGGAKNNFKVEAYMHRQGDLFASGYNHQKVTFSQESRQ